MSDHECDPVLEATGASGPLTTSRAMRLLLTYVHDQSLAGDAMPVLREIGDCSICMFAVMVSHLTFAASFVLNASDREQAVALLEVQLASALDQLRPDGGES